MRADDATDVLAAATAATAAKADGGDVVLAVAITGRLSTLDVVSDDAGRWSLVLTGDVSRSSATISLGSGEGKVLSMESTSQHTDGCILALDVGLPDTAAIGGCNGLKTPLGSAMPYGYQGICTGCSDGCAMAAKPKCRLGICEAKSKRE